MVDHRCPQAAARLDDGLGHRGRPDAKAASRQWHHGNGITARSESATCLQALPFSLDAPVGVADGITRSAGGVGKRARAVGVTQRGWCSVGTCDGRDVLGALYPRETATRGRSISMASRRPRLILRTRARHRRDMPAQACRPREQRAGEIPGGCRRHLHCYLSAAFILGAAMLGQSKCYRYCSTSEKYMRAARCHPAHPVHSPVRVT